MLLDFRPSLRRPTVPGTPPAVIRIRARAVPLLLEARGRGVALALEARGAQVPLMLERRRTLVLREEQP